LCDGTASAFQTFKRRDVTWVQPQPGRSFRLKGYEISEKTDGLLRNDYIRRDTDKKAVLFYSHSRAIETTLGHKGRLLLINDNEATKSNKVMLVDLESADVRQIDLYALKRYSRDASPDRRLFIVPVAYAFAPDDRCVLIKMELVDISAATREEAIKASKTYRKWWYVVDSSTGRVKSEYRADPAPARWWVSR
jgi:hypothetical protein